MRRREFITLLGGAAAWPVPLRAQQPMPVVGFLHSGSQSVWMPFANAFVAGLAAAGFVEGRNIAVEYRWAGGGLDHLPALAADLVQNKVSAIVASGGGIDSALAARAATSTIPIVFTSGVDPVKAGLVASLSHPGGNITGVSILNAETGLKRLQLLRELVPRASTVVMLANPKNPNTDLNVGEIELAARAAGQAFLRLTASTEQELNAAFESLGSLRAGALIVAIDPFFNDRSAQITGLAARYAVPAIYYSRVFVMADGLISYGGATADAYRQGGALVAKILRGANPAELPVQQSVKFELVINPQNGQNAGPRRAGHAAGACRRGDRMKRREFITLLSGAAAMSSISWPIAARARQAGKLPTIGFLGAATPSVASHWVAAFVKRLREHGWVEGRTVAIEYRWAEGRSERYAEIAAEFARLEVDVIVTWASAPVLAAKQSTTVVPIVFAAQMDPVGAGVVESLSRPGGNVTGLSLQQTETAGKRLELLREVVPGLRRLAIMANIGAPGAIMERQEVQATARALGLEVATLEIRRTEDIAPALEALKTRADALYIATDPVVLANRSRTNALARDVGLPTIYGSREYVEADGLMSYGPSWPDLFRRAADYVDKILHGAKPADLPVEQPTTSGPQRRWASRFRSRSYCVPTR
jgi:putative ABC transport system substrate-binding protein